MGGKEGGKEGEGEGEREEEERKGMMRNGSLIRLSREVRNDFFTIRLIPVSVTLPLSVVSL